MKCSTCGFAASDAGVTVCPPCNANRAGSAPPGAVIWPPAPTAAHPRPGAADVAAIQKQRQAGILMALVPLAALQGTSFSGNLLPAPYGSVVTAVVVLAGIYPHFRGCAHWAESKGYPRYEGRLLAVLGWLGVLFLAIRRDKTRVPA